MIGWEQVRSEANRPGHSDGGLLGRAVPRLRILVVDDETAIRHALRRALRPHLVLEADGYEQAQALIRAQSLDLVISDYRMPGRNGAAVLQMAEQNQPMAHRIMLSGSEPNDLVVLLQRGIVQRFISKPGHEELMEELASLAEARAASRNCARRTT
jgi:two-component system, probable response regulator PhcQ